MRVPGHARAHRADDQSEAGDVEVIRLHRGNSSWTTPMQPIRVSRAGRSSSVGGAAGIGATLVREFTAQGSRVASIDIEVQAAETLAAGLAKEFPNAPMFPHCDVTDTAALRDAIKTVEGPIHVLLDNAANDRRHKLEETTLEVWDASVAVDLRHQFFAAQAVAGSRRKSGGGSIVNFGSLGWMAKTAGMPAYTASKAAEADPLPGAGARPLQYPCQHAGPGLGDDREADAAVGGCSGRAADRSRAMPEGAGSARGYCAHGAVSCGRRQPDVHRADSIVDGGWV